MSLPEVLKQVVSYLFLLNIIQVIHLLLELSHFSFILFGKVSGNVFFFFDAEHSIHLTTTTLIFSSFCAGAVLISYGDIIGKVSGFQLMVCLFFETIGYALNERIGVHLGVVDIGGSMVIHTYGAVFRIILTKILNPRGDFGHKKAESNYISDVTSFMGTVFLWMYWPSFNAGPSLPGSEAQNRAFINTVLSLSGSCMITFVISLLTRSDDKKFNMVDIQNATLAGGVAMANIYTYQDVALIG